MYDSILVALCFLHGCSSLCRYIHVQNEKYEEAVTACTNAIKIDENHAKARFRRAQANAELVWKQNSHGWMHMN